MMKKFLLLLTTLLILSILSNAQGSTNFQIATDKYYNEGLSNLIAWVVLLVVSTPFSIFFIRKGLKYPIRPGEIHEQPFSIIFPTTVSCVGLVMGIILMIAFFVGPSYTKFVTPEYFALKEIHSP